MSKKVRLLLVLTIILTFVTALNVTKAQEPLKIGVLTDQSGALQVYGFEQTNGFELGLEYATDGTLEVAGRPVEVIIRDNGGDNDTALADARELIESEGVEILFGTVSSTVTLSLIETAKEYDTILMAGPAATPAITGDAFNENVFRVCRNSFHDALAIAKYGVETYGPNYVQLAPDNAFGQGSAGAFDFGFAQFAGVPVRETVYVAADTTDFTPAWTEVSDSGADFVAVTWAGASAAELFNQMVDLGIPEEMGVVTGFNSNDVIAALNAYQAGTVGLIVYHYTLPDNEVNDWLVENHRAKYNDVPDLFTECGFATAQALVAALETSEGSTLPEDLIPALEGLTFEGPKGTYTIRAEDHQALMPMYVVEFSNPEAEDFAYYTLLAEVSAEDSAPPCLAPGRSSETVTCPE